MKKFLYLFVLIYISPAFADIDLSKSQALWEDESGLKGTLGIKNANIIYEQNKMRSIQLELDLNAITINSIKDKKKLDETLNEIKSEPFFNTAKYPTAKLDLTKISKKNLGEGIFHLKGTQRPIFVHLNKKANELSGSLLFYIAYFNIASESDDPEDESVTITFKLVLK